jgi:hypothetical protein
MGVRSSRRWQKPATFAQVIGAGEGNRTLDIQLGKLRCFKQDQRRNYKTAPITLQSHQTLTDALQNAPANILMQETEAVQTSR